MTTQPILKEGSTDTPGSNDFDTDRKFFEEDIPTLTGFKSQRSARGSKIDFDDDQVLGKRLKKATIEMSSVESFKSIISEEVGQKEIKKHAFMDSKRRANCCSKWTYWYANKIVDSVNSNKGVLT